MPQHPVSEVTNSLSSPFSRPPGWPRIMRVNCLAQLLTIQAVLPAMLAKGGREAGGGSIINVSSVGALVALPHLAAYSASKAAVLGLTRGVAYELAECRDPLQRHLPWRYRYAHGRRRGRILPQQK